MTGIASHLPVAAPVAVSADLGRTKLLAKDNDGSGNSSTSSSSCAPGQITDRGAGVLKTYGIVKKYGYTTCGRCARESCL
eukprot:scaffold140413_cov41-Prasinocladus_malaysianus.AAC.1